MRQSVPLRKSESEARETTERTERTSRSIDEWLAAAVAEQAKRAAVRAAAKDPLAASNARSAAAADAPPVPTSEATYADQPAGSAFDQLQPSGRVADALGSVTSWIERAQEQLAATTRASQAAGERTTALVSDAIGSIGRPAGDYGRAEGTTPKAPSDALNSLARVEEDLAAGRTDPAGGESHRELESRIREIARQLDVPRRFGKRGMSPADEIAAAVAEIRSHQARLEGDPGLAGTSSPAEISFAPTPPPAPSVAEPPPPPQPARPSIPVAARERLVRDDRFRQEPIEPPPVRDRFEPAEAPRELPASTPERSVAPTQRSIAPAEPTAATEPEPAPRHRDSLAQRIAGIDPFSRLSRDIDVLSHKLDIVAASGVDPASIESIARDLADVRGALSGLPSTDDIGVLADQIADLKADLARVGRLQIDSNEFASLRLAFEDMRDALASRPDPAYGMEAVVDQRILQASRDELQPIAGMLATLVDKIERVERQIADPDALEQLERQIAGLTAAISDSAGRDPGLASLNHAMTELMSEVASWREGTVDLAERAARNAVAETIGSWNGAATVAPGREAHRTPAPAQVPSAPAEPPRSRLDLPRRAEPVETRVEPEYEQPSGPPEVSPERGRSADEALRRLNEALLLGQGLPEADRPLHPPSDEILLEPGSDRPRTPVATPAEPAPPQDARDVKASFIAAARRAAQAAAADADKGKASRPAPIAGTASPAAGRSPARLKGMFDRFRRPLLLSAASLVLAIGGYRLLQESFTPQPTRVTALSRPQSAAPPVVAAPTSNGTTAPSRAVEPPEPTTTQSVPDRLPTALPSAPPATDRPADLTATPEAREPKAAAAVATPPERLAAAASSKAETAPLAQSDPSPRPQGATVAAANAARPAAPDPAGALPASLRLAANAGDPAALYEMASRTMEGRGVARDARLAASMFEKAAEKNFPPAQYRLGNAYEKGVGVGRDLDQARRWYQRAAENGNTRAMHNLAVLMAEGVGGRPDYTSAIGWFQRAAEQGVRDSQFNLAVLFARGLGTSQDMVRSYTWFAIAAGAGDEEAGRKRDEVGARLSAPDLARAKAATERWRVTPANPAANDVQAAPGRWSSVAPARGAGREVRVGRA